MRMSAKRLLGVVIAAGFVLGGAVCLGQTMRYSGGDGTAERPYRISNATDLKQIGLHPEDWAKHFVLTADIDVAAEAVEGFEPIGYYHWAGQRAAFSGVFDGNDHSIRNFRYRSDEAGAAGLFGFVDGNEAEIRDLWIVELNITAEFAFGVGAVVGRLHGGVVRNVHVEAGVVTGKGDVGGLVGVNGGAISGCHFRGSVVGQRRVGGLVGNNFGRVEECFAGGTVGGREFVGGLVGAGSGADERISRVAYCYAEATVEGREYVGGLVGGNGGMIGVCYAVGPVSGQQRYGGLVGENDGAVGWSYWDLESTGVGTSAGGVGRTSEQMKHAETYVGWGDGERWVIDEGVDYPRLAWENRTGVVLAESERLYGGGRGTAEQPYLIATAEHLKTIGRYPEDFRCHFRLAADIDLRGAGGGTGPVIGYGIAFEGVFDGGGHVIRNVRISAVEGGYVGLFGCIGPSGEVRNLRLEGASAAAENVRAVGVLAGVNEGRVYNCSVLCNVPGVRGFGYVGALIGVNRGQVLRSSAWGDVSGYEAIGGVVGWNSGRLLRCEGRGRVRGIEDVGGLVGRNTGEVGRCEAVSNVSGETAVGGLVGGQYDRAVVRESFAGSYVQGTGVGIDVGGLVGFSVGSTIFSCYANSAVVGKRETGGLVGETDTGLVADCYAMGNVTAEDEVGGLAGENDHGRIVHCYSVGRVTAQSEFGGFLGENECSTVEGCFWDPVLSGVNRGVGNIFGEGFTVEIFGRSGAAMRRQITFTQLGWDFMGEWVNGREDRWRMCEDGESYPKLAWQFEEGDFICPDGVGLEDLEVLTSVWLKEEGQNGWKEGCDLNGDLVVDMKDFAIFGELWLERWW